MSISQFLSSPTMLGMSYGKLLTEIYSNGHNPESADQWLNKYTISGYGLTVLRGKVWFPDAEFQNERIVIANIDNKWGPYYFAQMFWDDVWRQVKWQIHQNMDWSEPEWTKNLV